MSLKIKMTFQSERGATRLEQSCVTDETSFSKQPHSATPQKGIKAPSVKFTLIDHFVPSLCFT